MDDTRSLLRHFLAAIAYRTQKALRGAPTDYPDFEAGRRVRTPHHLLCHMDSVLGYALTFFEGGSYRNEPLESFEQEIARFHGKLDALAHHLEAGTPFRGTSPEQMLQGPFSDVMTHAGQLAMLRRLSGSPIPPENFIVAEVDASNLGPEQPEPASPDEVWPERPE